MKSSKKFKFNRNFNRVKPVQSSSLWKKYKLGNVSIVCFYICFYICFWFICSCLFYLFFAVFFKPILLLGIIVGLLTTFFFLFRIFVALMLMGYDYLDEISHILGICVIIICYLIYFKDRYIDKTIDKYVDKSTNKFKNKAISKYVEDTIQDYRERFDGVPIDRFIDKSVNEHREHPWESPRALFLKKIKNFLKSFFGKK